MFHITQILSAKDETHKGAPTVHLLLESSASAKRLGNSTSICIE